MDPERLLTIEVDGVYYNIPTSLDGKPVDNKIAVKVAAGKIIREKNPPYPSFKSLDDALRAYAKLEEGIGA
jgi:hypothetical protein